MKIKVTNEKLMILIVLIIFLFGFPFRSSFLNGKFKYMDLPFLIVLFVFLIINRKNISYKKIILVSISLVITIISDLIYDATLDRFLIYFFMNTVPLLLLCINWDNIDVKTKSIKKIIKTYNFFIFSITIMYIIDLLTNGSVIKFISNNIVPYVKTWVPENGQSIIGIRYATFLGQYLETNYIYIVFYIINTYYNKSVTKTEVFCKQWIVNCVAIIGVLSSGSKVGFVVLTISLIIFNIKKIVSIIELVILSLASYFMGAFNLVFNRIQNESFSTGRYETWVSFLSSKLYKVHLFYGMGDNFSSMMLSSLGMRVAEITQELPFLFLFYKNGIIYTLIIIGILFIFPLLYKKNNFYTKYSIITIFLIINSYNGFLVTPDTLILYIFSIVLIFLITNNRYMDSEVV